MANMVNFGNNMANSFQPMNEREDDEWWCASGPLDLSDMTAAVDEFDEEYFMGYMGETTYITGMPEASAPIVAAAEQQQQPAVVASGSAQTGIPTAAAAEPQAGNQTVVAAGQGHPFVLASVSAPKSRVHMLRREADLMHRERADSAIVRSPPRRAIRASVGSPLREVDPNLTITGNDAYADNAFANQAPWVDPLTQPGYDLTQLGNQTNPTYDNQSPAPAPAQANGFSGTTVAPAGLYVGSHQQLDQSQPTYPALAGPAPQTPVDYPAAPAPPSLEDFDDLIAASRRQLPQPQLMYPAPAVPAPQMGWGRPTAPATNLMVASLQQLPQPQLMYPAPADPAPQMGWGRPAQPTQQAPQPGPAAPVQPARRPRQTHRPTLARIRTAMQQIPISERPLNRQGQRPGWAQAIRSHKRSCGETETCDPETCALRKQFPAEWTAESQKKVKVWPNGDKTAGAKIEVSPLWAYKHTH